MSQIETALGASFGGQQISIINSATDQFKVILELLPQYQQDAAALSQLYVATPRAASVATANIGSLVPLSAVMHITNGASPLAVNHFGQLPAVTISFSLPPGVALSDAVTKLEEVEQQIGMPASVLASFQGHLRKHASGDPAGARAFLLIGAILVVYIVLGILYGEFHPSAGRFH